MRTFTVRDDRDCAGATKRPWSQPRLVQHESLTALTGAALGPGVPFLLQITCSIPGGCGGPNPNVAPASPASPGSPAPPAGAAPRGVPYSF